MIELTMEEFILWVIGIPLLGIGFYTLIAGIRHRAAIRAARQLVLSCRACGTLYPDRSREKFPKCPYCGRPNERGRSRRLG